MENQGSLFNIFIVGVTKSGKSTLASYLSDKLGFPHVSASEWIRSQNPNGTVHELTQASKEELAKNPTVCVDFILTRYPTLLSQKGFIIEGIRNPNDFIALYNQKTDILFRLRPGMVFGATSFEAKGLDVIDKYVYWSSEITQYNHHEIWYSNFDELNEQYPEILHQAGKLLQ